MTKKRSVRFILILILCLLTAVLSLCLGAVRLSFSELIGAVFNGPDHTAGYIFWYSRFPRTIACLLSGAALSVSGCILQTILGNKLASPNIIGVNAGAGLFVTLCCGLGFLSGISMALSAFLGAFLTALLILFLSEKTGASKTTVILAGVAVNSILNAFRDAVTTLVPDTAMLSGEFRVGGFSAVSTSRLLPAGVLILFGFLVLSFLLNELDVLSLGDETAHSLGLSVRKMRIIMVLLAALLAGAAVSFSGLLGFVGLLVPHIARRLVGNESRCLIPFSALLGASLVTGCDLLSRLLFAPHEFYVGILLSIIGGPFFLFLLFKTKGGHRHE